jgi:hypothetical protein
MSFLISDVYSVTPSKGIEWYLYVFDVMPRALWKASVFVKRCWKLARSWELRPRLSLEPLMEAYCILNVALIQLWGR